MPIRTILGARASAILYDVLVAHGGSRPFLLPANVCPVVPLTFLKAKVPFEFLDISAKNYHVDLEEVCERISEDKGRYGGLLYVHTYGDAFTPNEAFAEIKRQGEDFLIIDDRCLCVPDLEGDPSNAADLVLYSTGHAKTVDLKFGGFAFLQDSVPYQHQTLPYQLQDLEGVELEYKRSVDSGRPYAYTDNDWLQSDADLPPWTRYSEQVRNNLKLALVQRKNINAIYEDLIPAELRLPEKYQAWRYNILVEDNRKTLAAIFAAGLFASAHYASLAGIFGPGAGANAVELAGHVVNLFNDYHYSLDKAEKTARIVLGSL